MSSITDQFYYADITNELFNNGKLVGRAHDSFIVLTNRNGIVLDYGFEDNTDFGTKALKINKRKLKNKKNKLYFLYCGHFDDLILMNSLFVGMNFDKAIFESRSKNIENNDIYKEIVEHFNEIVLTTAGDFKCVRLIGLVRDCMDFYYKFKTWDGQVSYDTCVGGFIIIKDKIEKRNYDNIKNIFLINLRCPEEKEINFEIHDDTSYVLHAYVPATEFKLASIWFQTKLKKLRQKISSILKDYKF